MTLERIKNKGVSDSFIIGLILLIITGGIIWWVTCKIKENYLQDDPKLLHLKQMLSSIHPEIDDIKLYKANKSYTINKEKIYLCLKDENGDYYSDNMLIYVFLHELAHFLNKDDIGHTEKFHEIFQDLLEKAHDIGVYNFSIPPIENYCVHN
jgi:hypothetical protein